MPTERSLTFAFRPRAVTATGPRRGRSFEELWHDLVFELYNSACAREFAMLVTAVSERRLSRGAFPAEMIRVESKAAEKARTFYIRVFLPWARATTC